MKEAKKELDAIMINGKMFKLVEMPGSKELSEALLSKDALAAPKMEAEMLPGAEAEAERL